MSRKGPHELLNVSFEKMCFHAVLKKLIVALALILFRNVFKAFAADTVNSRVPHKFLDLCSVSSSSLFAERIFPRSGLYGLTRLYKYPLVSRWDTVDCFKHKHGDFENDSLFDW